jgi:DNA-binding CsgD family transcriptional regulator/tetratricopeptide (TPR) repeat protein
LGVSTFAHHPLVGRREVICVFEQMLQATAAGSFQFLALVGEPGVGKTRLLDHLSTAATRHGLTTLRGRATEFEQELPFAAVIDALDDHLETHAEEIFAHLNARSVQLLRTVFPGLSRLNDELGTSTHLTGFARYQLYRAIRQLFEEMAASAGLVVILDDLHWSDSASLELLDHLVRHPPEGCVLIAASYRPAQAVPCLAALVEAAAGHGQEVTVDPFSQAEVEEFLGRGASPARTKRMHEVSGGMPFYLEALTRIGAIQPTSTRQLDVSSDSGELPPTVRGILQGELIGLSAQALKVAWGAAVAADEFESTLAAIAAEVPVGVAIKALDEMTARDVVRPTSAGRFRFRHPFVRHATYDLAPAGWRLGAHARLAAHLATLGTPAAWRAHHVERAGCFGDEVAIATLIEAAREVYERAPSAAAHWLQAALRLMPADHEARLDMLLELATNQGLSGQLAHGRNTARETLRLLPTGDHARRARAARICDMMERHLDRPSQGRAVLLDELHRIPDQYSSAAMVLRLRLAADGLLRGKYQAAQTALNFMPEKAVNWEPSLPLAIASMRPMPAFAAGQVVIAVRYIETAERLEAAAPDEYLAKCLDLIIWLCWTEAMMNRHQKAERLFDRAVGIARSTGQSFMLPPLLAGQAGTYAVLGRLTEAAIAAEEAAELATQLGSRQQLVMAMNQQCLVASWSGDDDGALRFGEQAVHAAGVAEEWWGAMAKYSMAQALLNAGQTDPGTEAMAAAFDGFQRPMLDPATVLSCCEAMAQSNAARGQSEQALRWADRADKLAHPALETSAAFAGLSRAHALSSTDPVTAAALAREAAKSFDLAGLRIYAGRARATVAMALRDAGKPCQAREEFDIAVKLFAACGARKLHLQTERELRQLGVRAPVSGRRGRSAGLADLSKRELQVATLVGAGHTNMQIAEKLFLSVRTVETHVAHIFAKLGINSRVGVVNALARQDFLDEKNQQN